MEHLRFTGLDLSPNHLGMISLNIRGEVTAISYVTDTLKGAKLANCDDRATALRYKHPSKKENGDTNAKEINRLKVIRDFVADEVHGHHATSYLAIEGYAWGANGREYQIGEVGGAVKLDLYEAGIPYRIHDPIAVKMFVAHKGNADKDAVMEKVPERWGFEAYLFDTAGAARKTKGRDTEGDLCDAYSLARMCMVEYKLRKGLLNLNDLAHDKERQVFLRTTKNNPINLLGRSWVLQAGLEEP